MKRLISKVLVCAFAVGLTATYVFAESGCTSKVCSPSGEGCSISVQTKKDDGTWTEKEYIFCGNKHDTPKPSGEIGSGTV